MNLAGIHLGPYMSTQHQRGQIVRLLRDAGLPTRTIAAPHCAIGVPAHYIGHPLDEWMSNLNLDAANGVINTLQQSSTTAGWAPPSISTTNRSSIA